MEFIPVHNGDNMSFINTDKPVNFSNIQRVDCERRNKLFHCDFCKPHTKAFWYIEYFNISRDRDVATYICKHCLNNHPQLGTMCLFVRALRLNPIYWIWVPHDIIYSDPYNVPNRDKNGNRGYITDEDD